jgi:hypothetical protein
MKKADRQTLVNKLSRIPELYEEARKYFTGDVSEWVKLGLFTEEELKEYQHIGDIQGKISLLISKAEDAIPFPDFATNPDYPDAYLAIMKRIKELEPFIKLDKSVNSTLANLRSSPYYNTIANTLHLSSPADKIQSLLRNSDSPLQDEYNHLNIKKERKERTGTKVKRIRLQIGDALREQRATAKEQIYTQVQAKYGHLLKRGEELDRLREQRRIEKLQPIRKEIRTILDNILTEYQGQY